MRISSVLYCSTLKRSEVPKVRKQFDAIAEQLGIQRQEDWYHITSKRVMKQFGKVTLRPFNFSISAALKMLYPEFLWHLHLFNPIPKFYFFRRQNHRQFMDWLAEDLGIEVQEDWYGVTWKDVSRYGYTLLQQYDTSVFKALQNIYPEFEWNVNQTIKSPHNFWKDTANHRMYFDWLSEQLGIERQEQWYLLTREVAIEHGAKSLLAHYSDSLYQALKSSYPEFTWNAYLFPFTSRNHSNNPQNLRAHFDWLSNELGIEKQEDWYDMLQLSPKKLRRFGRKDNEHERASNQLMALREAYPEFEWDTFRLKAPLMYFTEKKNQRAFLDWCAEQLGIETQEDWYKVLSKDITKFSGHTLIHDKYSGSIYWALSSIYTEYEWHPWMFQKMPMNQWANEANQKKWMEWAAEQLGIENITQWKDVTYERIQHIRGIRFVKTFGKSLLHSLERVYPEYDWARPKFPTSGGQQEVCAMLQKLLGDEVQVNYRIPSSKNGRSTFVELDIYIPSCSLAFEYQGAQHYVQTRHFGDLSLQQQRDEMKKKLCEEMGITLIQVPHWWSPSLLTLSNYIKRARPDVQFLNGVQLLLGSGDTVKEL